MNTCYVQSTYCVPLSYFVYENIATMWASLVVVQMVKNLPAMRETQVRSLGREDPMEKTQ